jgi:hypothetical protein
VHRQPVTLDDELDHIAGMLDRDVAYLHVLGQAHQLRECVEVKERPESLGHDPPRF